MLRMSWMPFVDHGEAARVMLALPLTKQSEVLEQLACVDGLCVARGLRGDEHRSGASMCSARFAQLHVAAGPDEVRGSAP